MDEIREMLEGIRWALMIMYVFIMGGQIYIVYLLCDLKKDNIKRKGE